MWQHSTREQKKIRRKNDNNIGSMKKLRICQIWGINIPHIKIVDAVIDAGEEIGEYDKYSGQHSKGLAYKAEQKIIIRPTRSFWRALSINSTRFTIAHEWLHLKYRRIRHVVQSDKRTKVLVEKWKEMKEMDFNVFGPSKSNFLNCYPPIAS